MNSFAKEFYSASNAARLYTSAFKTIPKDYGLGMSKALKAQMGAYKSITPASKYFEQALKAIKSVKPVSIALGQTGAKALQPAMSSNVAKQMAEITQQLDYSISRTQINQSDELVKDLRQTMKPLLGSNNVRLSSGLNNLIQQFSSYPSLSINKFINAANNPSKVFSQSESNGFRNSDEKAENDRKKKSNLSSATTAIRGSLDNFNQSSEKYAQESKNSYTWTHDPKKQMEYFLYFCQFLLLIYSFYAVAVNKEAADTLLSNLIDTFLLILEQDKH